MIGRLLDSARALVRRKRFEVEMAEELEFHLARQIDALVREGVDPVEARRRARAAFGAAEGFKDDAREARGIGWLDALRGDLRFGWRTLRRAPGYSLVVIGTLALGIGANTTIFSVIDGVLLKPLPFPESERLVQINPSYPASAIEIYRKETTSYQAVGNYTLAAELNLLVDGAPERIKGRNVSTDFFEVLGARAAVGRLLRPAEDGAAAPLVAVISDGLWRRRFAADPAALGRTLVVDGTPRELVGILPAGFAFPVVGTEIWIPNRLDPSNLAGVWGPGTTFIGRLKPGVTIELANAEHRGLITRVRDAFPWRMPDEYGQEAANRVRGLGEVVGEGVQGRLVLLLAAVGLILLVACANVANLNLTRVAAREREFAVRQAIGGTRGRIGRQVLVEQLLLSSLGGALGIVLAVVGTPSLVRWLPADTPRLDAVVVDARVLGFTAIAVLVAGLLSALGPMVRATTARGAEAFGAASRSAGLSAWGRRLSAALVVAEVGLAVLLVVGAGILLRSLGALLRQDAGVRVNQLVTARITQDLARCGNRMGECAIMFGRIRDQLAAIPGVSGVALASMVPLDGQVGWFAIDIEDHPVRPGGVAHQLNSYRVTPEYFGLVGIRLEEGRLFTPEDRWGRGMVLVVGRALANQFWRGQSVVGKRMKPVWLREWATIVGVVSDVRQEGLARPPGTDFYWSLAQWGSDQMTAVLETALPAPVIEPAIRQAVASVDPVTPVSRVQSMAAIRRESVSASRTTAQLLGLFAVVGLLLGAIGVYGVLSHGVSRRRQEIGIRMAMGAEPGRVRRLIVRQAMGLVGAGLVVGVITAWGGAGLLRRFAFGVGVRDPVTFAAVPVLFLAVGFLAAYLPARRATRVPPTEVLRVD